MTLTINDTTMTSDQTAHTARLASGSPHLWEVSCGCPAGPWTATVLSPPWSSPTTPANVT
jgi:hypothetical protein